VCSPSLGTRSAGTDPIRETGHPHTPDVARIVALRARRGLVSFRCGQIVARFVWFRFDSLRLAAKRGPLRFASLPYVAVSIRSCHASLPNVAVSFANAPVRPVRYQRRTHTLCRTATSRTSPTCWGDLVKLPGGTSPSCRGDLTDLPGELCQASWNSVTPRGLASLRLAVASHWPASPCSVSPGLQGGADALLPAGPARLRQHYPAGLDLAPKAASRRHVALQTSRLQRAGSRHLGLARTQPPRLPMQQAAPAPGTSRPAPGASRPSAGPPRSWRRAICSSTASAAHSLTSTRD
jgi:hypothetical protein